jgi:hypothetical protein
MRLGFDCEGGDGWVPRSWTFFVHERVVGSVRISRGSGTSHPAHDDETVMNGAPRCGDPTDEWSPRLKDGDLVNDRATRRSRSADDSNRQR